MLADREIGWIQKLTLLFSVGVSVLVTAVLGPSLPQMQAHFSELQNADYLTGLNMTIPMLVMACFCVFAGAISDRFGRKWVYVIAACSYAVIGTMPLYLDNIHHILLSRFALGFCEAFVMVIGVAMIGDLFKGNERNRLLALQTTVASFSAFALNNIGGVLGEISWRAPYITYGFGLILAISMAIFLWEPDRRASANELPGDFNSQQPEMKPFLIAFTCVAAIGIGFLFLSVPIHFGYLFANIGVTSSAQIGMAYGLNSLGVICGTLIFGFYLAHKWPVAKQFFLGFALMALGFWGMSSATSLVSLTASGIIQGLGGGILLPAVVIWNMRLLPTKIRGLGTGALQSGMFLGQFLSSIILIWVARQLGGRPEAFGALALVCAALVLFVLVAVLIFKE